MQDQLWDTTQDPITCRFPMLEPASAYRYGCRCPKCAAAKQAQRNHSPYCQHAQCQSLRVKHSRWCEQHRPATPRRRVRREADCELCGRTHGWYETVLTNVRDELQDLYRRTCSSCRGRYIAVVKTHRLDTNQALRLIAIEACELCGSPFTTDGRGRKNVHVDHDHACCPGHASCGLCVRGFLCPRCNHVLASVETANSIGLDRVLEYLNGHRF